MNGRITRAGQTQKQYIKRLINSKVEDRIVHRILDPKVREAKDLLRMAELGQKYEPPPPISEAQVLMDILSNKEL